MVNECLGESIMSVKVYTSFDIDVFANIGGLPACGYFLRHFLLCLISSDWLILLMLMVLSEVFKRTFFFSDLSR